METAERRKVERTGAELEERTLVFAVDLVKFVGAFHRSDASSVIGRQLLRAGTSVGANYREANRAESRVDFAHKVAISVKEAAETEYWPLLAKRVEVGDPAVVNRLLGEADELIAILSTILRRARRAP